MIYDNYIGIDPDTECSGLSFLETKTKRLECLALSFFQLFDYLKFVKEQSEKSKETVQIIVECGYLNLSNWHVNPKQSNAVSAKIGNSTGRNHEVARKIIEMCQYLKLDYKEVRPTTEKWTPTACKKITGVNLKSINSDFRQDVVDAIKLIWR